MRAVGQITIHNVRDGESAEFYRLKVVREEAVVNGEGILNATFSYSIEYVKGSTVTTKEGKEPELYVACKTNKNENVDITEGIVNSGTFTLSEYVKSESRPDFFIVELKKGDEVLETRNVQVMMEAASYTKIVNDMRETVSTNGKAITRIKQDANSIKLIAEGLRTGVRNLLTGGKVEKTYHTYGYSEGKTNIKLKPNTTYTMTVSGHISTEAVAKGQTLQAYIIANGWAWSAGGGNLEIDSVKDVTKHYTFTTPETLPNDGVCTFDAYPTPNKMPHEANGDITVNWAVVTEGTAPAAEWLPSVEESAEEQVKRVELKLEKGEFKIKSDKTVFVDNTGKETVLIKDGKISAELIDAKSLRTLPSKEGLHIEMYEGTFDVFTKDGKKGISMTVDADGYPHLIFFDKNGQAKYDLGYTGLKELVSAYRAAYWTKHTLVEVTGSGLEAVYPKTGKGKLWHEYHAPYHYATGKLGEHADEDGRLFEIESFGSPIPDGWYTDENSEGQFLAGGNDMIDDGDPHGVPKPRVYGVKIYKVESGKFNGKATFVWFKVENDRKSFCKSDGSPLVVQVGLLQNYPSE